MGRLLARYHGQDLLSKKLIETVIAYFEDEPLSLNEEFPFYFNFHYPWPTYYCAPVLHLCWFVM